MRSLKQDCSEVYHGSDLEQSFQNFSQFAVIVFEKRQIS